MDKSAFIAGLIDAFFLIGLLTHVYPYSNRFVGMMPLAIVGAWLLSYTIIRGYIYNSYGVPFPWDRKGWKEYNE